MDVTIHEQPCLGFVTSSTENPQRSYNLLWKQNSKFFQHKILSQSLRIDVCGNPSWTFRLNAESGSKRLPQKLFNSTDDERHSNAIEDQITAFVALLRACTKNKDLCRGTRIHDHILQIGLLDVCSDALATMYAKCGALGKAKALIDMHKSTNVIPWTALIAGYVRAGQGQDALDCYDLMKDEGIHPDAFTYSCILKACGTVRAAEKGKQIHDEIARQGLAKSNLVLGNSLVDMYAKCGAIKKAQHVLEELPFRDVVSWSTLIAGYAQEGQGKQALNCFKCMQHEGILPDAVTYACMLKACGCVGNVDKGKQIHDEIVRQGLLQNNIVLGNALVDMYAKCGALSDAQGVLDDLPFRDIFSWNALIAGYAQEGQGERALSCFEHMQGEDIPPDAVTYACILKACSTIEAADKGKKIHDEISRQGLLKKDIVLGNALVDMYAKCGALSEAWLVLEELPSRNVVCWSALISGYAQEGQGEQALTCFDRMQQEGISPNVVTYASVLKACGTVGAADKGAQIHHEIVGQGLLKTNVVLGNALVDMYAKCGALSKAERVLEELSSRDVVSWSALIAGYAQEGQGEQALSCFERMQRECVPPNVVTFACVLNVCSHLGLVEKGNVLFANMSTTYGVKPNLECYTCMIGLLGRAGHLEKAVRLIQEMPSSDHSAIWITLLGACQKWRDVHVGRWAFQQAVQVDKSNGSAYVIMANIYAAAGMQENAKIIEAMRIRNKALSTEEEQLITLW